MPVGNIDRRETVCFGGTESAELGPRTGEVKEFHDAVGICSTPTLWTSIAGGGDIPEVRSPTHVLPGSERLFADSVPLHQRELPDLGHPALEEVRAAHQVAHVAVVHLCGGVGDRLLAGPSVPPL